MARIPRFVVPFLFLLLALPMCAGCGPAIAVPPDLPELVPCTLILTQEGAPLHAANIVLMDENEGQRWFAGGQTDAQGTAVLLTNGRYHGSPRGQFKVVVTKIEDVLGEAPPCPPSDDPGYGPWLARYAYKKSVSYSLIRREYADPRTTPLEIAITGSKPVEATFDVGEKVRVKVD